MRTSHYIVQEKKKKTYVQKKKKQETKHFLNTQFGGAEVLDEDGHHLRCSGLVYCIKQETGPGISAYVALHKEAEGYGASSCSL